MINVVAAVIKNEEKKIELGESREASIIIEIKKGLLLNESFDD